MAERVELSDNVDVRPARKRPCFLLTLIALAVVLFLGPSQTFAALTKKPPKSKVDARWRRPGYGLRLRKSELKRVNIVLLKDYEYLGKEGDRFRIKKGYYRNYLFPHGIAAKESAFGSTEKVSKVMQQKLAKEKAEMGAFLDDKRIIEKAKVFKFVKKLREKGGTKIYGSVSQANVAEQINLETGIVVKSINVEIPKIVELGTFPGKVQLSDKVDAYFEMKVVAEGAEEEGAEGEETEE